VTEGSTPAGLDQARVAELIVTHPGGGRRGSGYRVTATGVLTAAHVLEDASAVRVRFEPDLPGQWETPALSWWVDPQSDLAVISIEPVSITAKPDDAPLSPSRFGRIRAEAAVLSVQAVGFPAWKMRNRDGTAPIPGDGKDKYRDACHAFGSAPVLSNSREGTLEIVVAPPGDRPATAGSPWAGMSGAPVWVGDRIVGVLTSQHPGDGLGRLAAARLDLALDGLDPEHRAKLQTLLPTLPAQLPDVVPLSSGQLALTAYRAQLADIAPDQLRDRDRELDQLVTFCAGERAYDWWQAGPWAGKSALLSWFVLHPPAGVDVVSFFITSRLAGQSDSAAYTEALIEQLAALAGESPREALDARGSRHGHAVRLLHTAAQRAEEAGRRLLLVVDGLDEDTSVESGQPSIASLLPRRPPPGVRILVASRPHPELPNDVDGDHPLRTLNVVELDVSAHARDQERAAKRELSALLTGPELPREIIGLVLASGGGLTGRDLQDLTKRAPYELDRLLNGALGRSIESRVSTSVGPAAERVHLFAHETLREIAQQQYGASVVTYRDRLHAWTDDYRSQGWPTDTPTYLLRGYPRMLTEIGDTTRLVACATDPARHARMRELTGGDALALTELTTTTNLITRQPAPDLAALILLAMARDDLAQRNDNIPAELPAAWITLNQPARAIALANGIPGAYTRVTALTFMVTAANKAGKHDLIPQLAIDAERIARDITDPWQRADLSELVTACATAGEHDRAERIARDITDPWQRANALSKLVTACATAGEHDRAERIAQDITDPGKRANALSKLVTACATASEHDRAERIAQDITNPGHRAEALTHLAGALVGRGHGQDRIWARELVVEVLGDGDEGWQSALDLVARLEPAALRIVCDVVLARSAGERDIGREDSPGVE
jgi:Trypsin-like peptidase domain